MPDTTILPIAFLLFGAAVVLMQVFVLYRKSQGFGPKAVRMIGLTILITTAASLAASTVALERFTALVGLFGTLAGYLAGKSDSKEPG